MSYKQITHKNLVYDDLIVVDGDIILQSVTQDVHFEGGYNEVVQRLKDEWWSLGAIGSQRNYINEYEVEAMLDFIKDRDGIVVVNNLN